MTDETTTQPQGEVTPVEPATPAAPATPEAPVDVESIVSSRLAEFSIKFEEDRLKPLQRLISERDETIQQLKTASMSEDEREQLKIDQEQRERDAFEAERWLFQKAKQNSTAADLFQKVLNIEDPEDQWAVFVDLASRLQPTAPTPAPAPEASEQVPDVDPNNPAPTRAPGLQGQIDDKAFREDYLKHTPWPSSR